MKFQPRVKSIFFFRVGQKQAAEMRLLSFNDFKIADVGKESADKKLFFVFVFEKFVKNFFRQNDVRDRESHRNEFNKNTLGRRGERFFSPKIKKEQVTIFFQGGTEPGPCEHADSLSHSGFYSMGKAEPPEFRVPHNARKSFFHSPYTQNRNFWAGSFGPPLNKIVSLLPKVFCQRTGISFL